MLSHPNPGSRRVGSQGGHGHCDLLCQTGGMDPMRLDDVLTQGLRKPPGWCLCNVRCQRDPGSSSRYAGPRGLPPAGPGLCPQSYPFSPVVAPREPKVLVPSLWERDKSLGLPPPGQATCLVASVHPAARWQFAPDPPAPGTWAAALTYVRHVAKLRAGPHYQEEKV